MYLYLIITISVILFVFISVVLLNTYRLYIFKGEFLQSHAKTEEMVKHVLDKQNDVIHTNEKQIQNNVNDITHTKSELNNRINTKITDMIDKINGYDKDINMFEEINDTRTTNMNESVTDNTFQIKKIKDEIDEYDEHVQKISSDTINDLQNIESEISVLDDKLLTLQQQLDNINISS